MGLRPLCMCVCETTTGSCQGMGQLGTALTPLRLIRQGGYLGSKLSHAYTRYTHTVLYCCRMSQVAVPFEELQYTPADKDVGLARLPVKW